MNIRLCILFLLGILLTTPAQYSFGQDQSKENWSTARFEIDVEKFNNSKIVTAIGAENIGRFLTLENIIPDLELSDVKSFSGAFDFSGEWDEIANMGMNNQDLPFEFVFKFEFKSNQIVDMFREEMKDNSTEHEHNGKTYFGPPETDFGPENLRVLFGDGQIILGTTDYVYQEKFDHMSEGLSQLWATLPENTVARGAFDLEASRDIVDGFTTTLSEEFSFDPTMKMVAETTLKFITKTESAAGHADLDSEKFLSLQLDGNDAKANEEIAGVLNGLLFMGAMPLKGIIDSLPLEEAERKPLLNLAEQLKADRVNDQVVIEINKPEQFEQLASQVYYPRISQWLDDYQLRNDFQTVALAAVNYSYSNDEKFPFLIDEDSTFSQELSWRGRILNYGYSGGLYQFADKVDTTAPWKHESNQKASQTMPKCFGKDGQHSNVVWVKTNVKSRDDIKDSAFSTIMLIRLPEATQKNWLEPGDDISMIKVIQLVSKLKDGESILAATYDGRVLTINNSWDHNKVKSYLTPAAGDNIEDHEHSAEMDELLEIEIN